ncbi:MAG: pyrroline-5-carboxylate reductase [Rhodospirillaceae bacterium]|nr:pyrroline-5-carboxylate reductase [Rhodospirillaceae bacterium]|tara:strand:- start:569 stop:886 length:318 start_codon:yes stop_codon:yes gene_type:complete
MQTENRFFDDLARVASGAVGTIANMRTEIETLIKQRLERMLSDMNLVPREEFDAVKIMAAKARKEQEVLVKRVAALEKSLKSDSKLETVQKTAKAGKNSPKTAKS